MRVKRWGGAAACALGLIGSPAMAVTLGMVDTFQDGTTNGWGTGINSGNPPVNAASGGPAGAADKYLLATATGAVGAGGKLVTFNTAQWTGDYVAASVTAVAMDLKNFGSTELDLHLALIGAAGLAYTTVPLVLPAGAGWTHATFSLLPADLSGTLAVLSSVTELRLYHGDALAQPVAASLGVDNIAAVPEPATALTLAAGLSALLAMACWRARRPQRRRPR